jgi:hypothetical protein
MNEWIMLLIGLVAGLVVFGIGIKVFPQLARQEQGYPKEEEIERALLPFAFNAISAAYKVSEKAIDDVQQRLQGADKAAIARQVYRMLPDRVGGYDVTTIKNTIGEERFAELVEGAYGDFDQFFEQHQNRFDQLYEDWKKTNAPGQGTA